MQEREMIREAGLEVDFHVDTKEEAEARYAESRMARQRKMLAEGKILIKGKERPWRLTSQGILRTYTADWLHDVAIDSITFFHHLIPHHSGKHRHQGGFSLFVLEGKGYTVVDGVRHDWKEGDLILLPIKVEGCEHQHFNTRADGKPSRWMAMPVHYALDATSGAGGGQRETSPLWQKYRGDYMGVIHDTKKLKWEEKKKK